MSSETSPKISKSLVSKGKKLLTVTSVGAVLFTAASDGTTIPNFFATNWSDIGGWGLFISLCLIIVLGAFLEWWVPGRRHRRVEEAAAKQSETLASTVELLKEQTQANQITKHFFEKTVPKIGDSPND